MFSSERWFQMHKQPWLCVQPAINHPQSRTEAGEEQLLPVPHKNLVEWDAGWQQGIADEVNHGICISCELGLWEGSSRAVYPPWAAWCSRKNKYIFHEEFHLNHISSSGRWGFLSCLEGDLLRCLQELVEATHYKSTCSEQGE